MVAIISRYHTSTGEHIQLLGIGATEEAARQAAYRFLHHGHNPFDEYYDGGELVSVAPALADRLQADDYNEVMGALSRLTVIDGVLTTA